MKRVVLQQNKSSFFQQEKSYSSTEIPFFSQVITANHQIKQVKNNEFILRLTHKAKKKKRFGSLIKTFLQQHFIFM